MNFLELFNNKYATAVATIIAAILLIKDFIWVIISKKSKCTNTEVKPSWFSINDKFKVVAVQKFEKSDDASGYRHISQNSRPDQWKKLIEIRRKNILWLYIKPVDPTDILTVVISRNGKEQEKTISFNK